MRYFRLEAALFALVVVGLSPGATDAAERTTYSVDFRVRVSEESTEIARVRWRLTGIDEIRQVRISIDRDRFYDFSGSGKLSEDGDTIVWRPGGPYAHLDYKVRLRHRRRGEGERYDGYATSRWIITRADSMFPRVRVTFSRKTEPNPRSRSFLSFGLPTGWRAHSSMEEISRHVFRVPHRGRRFDRPRGWLALGKLEVATKPIGGTQVTVARTPASRLDAPGLLALYERVLPPFKQLLGGGPDRILVVSAMNPMWRGGISAEGSFFLHGARGLRTADRTSPPLHELFHVLAPFQPAKDGVWVTEGLAEYYSLELQRRTGLLSEAGFRDGLDLFLKHGKWHVNLAAVREGPATYNSASLLMHVLEQRIRRASGGKRGLDDAVRDLARRGGKVSTAAFLRAVSQAAGENLAPFFQRHVYLGQPPKLDRPDRDPA